MDELKGKVAVITGSSRGIGFATAQLFADEGAHVVMNGRKREALDEAVARVPGAIGLEGNVGDPGLAEALVDLAFERFGRLDVAMANAATTVRSGPVTEMSDDAWDRSIRVNLTGAFYLVRAAGRTMTEQQSGSIIVVGSIAGARGMPGQVAYSAAKAGHVGLVGAAAKDLGPASVRVNLILPSAVTVAVAAMNQEWLAGISPLKRTGRPEDVAQLALFLACDRSAFVTGETINVDGGIHSNWGDLPA